MVIIEHLGKYPLITQKSVDFELFKKALTLVINKEHLGFATPLLSLRRSRKRRVGTKEGLANIINLKASMNFGVVSDSMLAEFPNIKPVERPLVQNIISIDPDWLNGFVEGEGCFFVNIYKRKDSVLGEGVKLVFKITQDKRNQGVLELFSTIFGCGKIYEQNPEGTVFDFMVTGFKDMTEKVIPFFLEYPLKGAKLIEFQAFMRVAELMKNKAHLTKEGLAEIWSIKNGMNQRRKYQYQ